MNDEGYLIRVARGTEVIGEFYLSKVELSLKEGLFKPEYWGWMEGMENWVSLGEIVRETREKEGKKRLATGAQRAYLRGCGYEPWRGMANCEAHGILNALHEAHEFKPGKWLKEPISDAQIAFLQKLGCSCQSHWTKGEASLAIAHRLEELEITSVQQTDE